MKKTILLLPWLALSLAAADISGKWSGTIEITEGAGGPSQTPVSAEFIQKSDAVSGKIGRRGGDQEEGQIRNGKVEGDKVEFEVTSPETTSPMKFSLTLEGDHLTGEMKGAIEEGQIVGKVDLTRAKAASNHNP